MIHILMLLLCFNVTKARAGVVVLLVFATESDGNSLDDKTFLISFVLLFIYILYFTVVLGKAKQSAHSLVILSINYS